MFSSSLLIIVVVTLLFIEDQAVKAFKNGIAELKKLKLRTHCCISSEKGVLFHWTGSILPSSSYLEGLVRSRHVTGMWMV